MRAERDFDLVDPVFFSTSQAGGAAPDIGRPVGSTVQDANDLAALARLPMLISTQGGDYTQAVHSRLARLGLGGLLDRRRVDACAWPTRSVIVLDPVNLPVMRAARERGHQGFHRRQLHGLADAHGGVRAACARAWSNGSRAMTYQSASGAGAQNMREIAGADGRAAPRRPRRCLANPASAILDIDRAVTGAIGAPDFPKSQFGAPLGREPDPVDRQGSGQRPEPRGMEGGRRVEQDHGHRRLSRCRSRASACA